ncbi:MAG TPA: dihydrodipicolinate synthase family protein [Candidatus Tumulicola sp.]
MADSRAPLSGIWAATLTPVDTRFAPDTPRALEYYRELLDGGCDGLNVLGTTGEAMSFGVERRIAFMESLARSLPASRMMAGTGAASLEDTIRLTRAALDAGFRAALVLPPFFFRDASVDGVVRFYVELANATPKLAGRLLLYNFPKMSGFAFTPAVVRRMSQELPDVITGVKDSSNDRDLQRALATEFPRLSVFAGSEGYLPEAKAAGASGCISGTVALWPQFAQRAFRGDAEAANRIALSRDAFSDLSLIPAVRYAVAQLRGDDTWLRPVPPLEPMSREQRETLEIRLTALER